MCGLYIHVPFCGSRCIYCDFYSTTEGKALRSQYVSVLCEEIKSRGAENGFPSLRTIYIGGGTPSLLSTRDELTEIIKTVREHFDAGGVSEFTIEANPDDVTPGWVQDCLELGINRVSLGVQSFDDSLLSFLSRRHTAQQACDAVDLLHESGLHNISIDLIFGLPGQTPDGWRQDLKQALALPVKHLSAYALMYEPGTALYAMREKGFVHEADEETSLSMFEALEDATRAAGFEHYEISNFARPGYRSQHNSSYWNGTPYIGVGPGAHSFDGTSRRRNLADLRAYVTSAGKVPYETELLTKHDCYDEYVMTRLRTSDGLSTDEISRRFGPDFGDYFRQAAAPHLQARRLEETEDGRLRLSRAALFVSDDVMSDLMWPDEAPCRA